MAYLYQSCNQYRILVFSPQVFHALESTKRVGMYFMQGLADLQLLHRIANVKN